MPYEKVVLSDGAEVLFAMPETPDATGANDADTEQRDTPSLPVLPHRGALEHSW
jgi:hypothetical protein